MSAKPVKCCGVPMQRIEQPLISGRLQIDSRCSYCGAHEREIHSRAGLPLRWMNMKLKATLALA